MREQKSRLSIILPILLIIGFSHILFAESFIDYLKDSKFSPPLIGALSMVLLMALLLMASFALGSEELKQFVRTELGQALVTVFIVIFIAGIISGLDLALESVASNITSPCVGVSIPSSLSNSLLINKYAYCYISNLYSLAVQAAKDSLKEGVDYAKKASASYGTMTTTAETIYIGFSARPDAALRLDSEIKSQEFSLHQSFLISLLSQRYVLETAAPAIGSAALFFGVILRSIFFTRRLGGLLIAAGIGLLLVWPATYLLSWLTLNVAVFGPQVLGDTAPSTCPASCLIKPPYGYNISTNPGGTKFAAGTLSLNELNAIASSKSASTSNVTAMRELGVQPCYPSKSTKDGEGDINYTDSENCPAPCRFYPTPPDCNITACAKIPPACKTIRAINLSDMADDCIGENAGANPQNPNSDWLCSASSCPNYCKQLLPQVKKDPSSPIGVSPSKNADLCGLDEDCTKCALSLRSYHYNGDNNTIVAFAKSNENCKACMQKYKDQNPDAQNQLLPDCMLGIPDLLLGNCDLACGQRMDIQTWLKNGAPEGICPLDCRIIFSQGQEAYKDPTYIKYCEQNATVKSACSICPIQCKINASNLGAEKKDDSKCAQAPKFNREKIDLSETSNCRLCPMSCRFKNIIIDANLSPFLSKAHYPIICNYYPRDQPSCGGDNICLINHSYKQPQNQNTCPPGWLEYDRTEKRGSCPSTTVQPPKCSPSPLIYQLAEDIFNKELCPPFIADYPQFVASSPQPYCPNDNVGIDPLGRKPGYVSASIQPNTDISAECSNPTAAKYCTDDFCPSDCKADRQKDGPFYCTLSNIQDKNALIYDNQKRCPSCAIKDGKNTTGPQCQVLLLDNNSKSVYFPQGCDVTNCSIGSVDSAGKISNPIDGINPTKNIKCNGFCFPRLIIPLGSDSGCNPYSDQVSVTTTGPNNLPQFRREFANASSCPLNCRYDYQKSRPSLNMESCGDGFNPKRCQDCYYALNNSENQSCSDLDHYNNCSQIRGFRDGGWWFKWNGLNQNPHIVEYNSSCPLPDVLDQMDEQQRQERQEYRICFNQLDSNRSEGYVFTKGPIYLCSPLHKYPELDIVLGFEKQGDYRECGELNVSGKNPKLNLCNQISAKPYSSNLPTPSKCIATYDATTVACQQLVASTNPPAPNHCLNCPLFCRSILNEKTICSKREGRNNTGWDRGGNAPICGDGSSSICDMRTSNSPQDKPSFLPGFCGVDSSVFKVPSPCQLPNEGYGVLCPVRCRILIDANNPSLLPQDCQTDEIKDACNVSTNLPLFCRASPPSRLCQGCLECQSDCLALPLVRRNCHELCLPSDFASSGASDKISASSLVSAMGGAVGNTAWRNIGNEAIAAFVLPIFCIVLTISFIRSLSPFLGGDIELPGLFKLI